MPKQDVKLEIFYDGDWQDITGNDDVFTSSPIVIKHGQADEGSNFRPCSITCTLANDDDRYRTSNPESPLYGKAGRNSPTRVSVKGNVRGVAEALSWKSGQTQDFRKTPRRGKAWVDLEAGGTLARIGQWTDPIRSPFYVYNAALTTSVGYWPLEDKPGSILMAQASDTSAFSGANPGVSFGGQNRPPGSAPLADFSSKLGSGVRAYGYFQPGGDPNSTAGWQVSFTAKLGSLGDVGDFMGPITFDMTNKTSYSIAFTDGTDLTLLANASDGTTLINSTTNISGAGTDWGTWNTFIFTGTYSAGTTTFSVYWMQEDGILVGAFAGSFVGVTSSPRFWRLNGGGFPDTVTLGHLIATTGVSEDLSDPARHTAFLGHLGEKSAYRFGRLCDLLGVPYYVSNGFDSSVEMGPQPYGTFADNLKEIASSEDGLIFDFRTELKLYFLCRVDRYTQTPTITLYPTDLPNLPEEVVDDLRTHNVVTVSQRDGGDVTAEDSTTLLGSQSPPDGVGETRQTVDVNIYLPETRLAQHANWWLRRGTVNLPRYPQVELDLAAVPSLIPFVENLRVGHVISITGFRENTILLHVIGWTEKIGTHTRTITLTCEPDQQFRAGTWDGTASKWGSATHFLKTAASKTDTSLVFRSLSSKVVWGTNYPYDVMLAGERVTVTNMTSASLVSGGYEQTATVRRASNGIFKVLPANTTVSVVPVGKWVF